MVKSLGTNLHLWSFFTRAKQTATRKFIYVCLAPSPPRPTMLDTCTRYFSQGSTLYGGGGVGGKTTHFETENSAFLNIRFKHTENYAITQVSQGILSTIVWFSRLMEKCTIAMFFIAKCI